MKAVSAPAPADSAAHAYEFKWDGYRALAAWNGRAFSLTSRNLLDLTPDYPSVRPLGKALSRLGPVLLDGELVAFDASGRPSFNRLQNASGRAGVTYMIFDVLYLRGRNLMRLAFAERRRILDGLRLRGPGWSTPPSVPGDASGMLAQARKAGHEGLIAKKLDSPYRPGERSGEWVKMKFSRRQEFVVGGWLPGEGAFTGSLGSLLLGYHRDGRLVFAGKVGTGFSRADRDALAAFLPRIAADRSPFEGRPPVRRARYVDPGLVAEVEFTEWTPDGRARHPSFKGLRTDKRAAEVILEPDDRH